MFYSKHIHGCRQWISWIISGLILSMGSTSFALIIGPSDALPSNSQEISPANSTGDFAPQTEAQPDSLIDTTEKVYPEASPQLDIHRQAPIKTRGSSYFNNAPQTTELKTLETDFDSGSDITKLRIVDIPKETDTASRSTQIRKFPVVLSNNRTPIDQTTVEKHDSVFFQNDTATENHPAVKETMEDSLPNKFNFIMNFGDTLELREREESTLDATLNWFYELLQQLVPDYEPERLQIDTLTAEQPVTEEQLKVWLKNLIIREFSTLKGSENNLPGWSSNMFSPESNNVTVEKLKIESNEAFNFPNNYYDSTVVGSEVLNYDKNSRQDLYYLQNGILLDHHPSRSPEKPDAKKRHADNNSAKHSFIVKALNFILQLIKSVKIWLHSLFHP